MGKAAEIIEHKFTKLALGLLAPAVVSMGAYIINQKLDENNKNFADVKSAIVTIDKNYRRYSDSILIAHKRERRPIDDVIFSEIKALHKDSAYKAKIDQIYNILKTSYTENAKKKDLLDPLLPIQQNDNFCLSLIRPN